MVFSAAAVENLVFLTHSCICSHYTPHKKPAVILPGTGIFNLQASCSSFLPTRHEPSCSGVSGLLSLTPPSPSSPDPLHAVVPSPPLHVPFPRWCCLPPLQAASRTQSARTAVSGPDSVRPSGRSRLSAWDSHLPKPRSACPAAQSQSHLFFSGAIGKICCVWFVLNLLFSSWCVCMYVFFL